MVGIVESVEEVFVERVDVLQSRKPVEDGLELFGEGLGGEFDLASVEICRNVLVSLRNTQTPNFLTSDSANFEACADLSWQSPLGSAEDNVNKFLRGWHGSYLLPGGLHLVVKNQKRQEIWKIVAVADDFKRGRPQNFGVEEILLSLIARMAT